MRIVLAHDLSPDADRAVGVVAAGRWPPGTVVRVVTSPVGVGEGVSSFAGAREARAHARLVVASIESAHARVTADLARAGLRAETARLAGPPGGAVVDAAQGFEADLVVAGARAQTSVGRALLGSVSTEITERASCSVLIVRVEAFGRVLLATDGSTPAETAESAIADWPIFDSADVRAIAVESVRLPYLGLGLSETEGPQIYGDRIPSSGEPLSLTDRAVERLARAGRRVESRVAVGNPADEIIAAAREWPADVVVIGSTGPSLVRRLVVGSVARVVLHGVQSSVLLVRPRT